MLSAFMSNASHRSLPSRDMYKTLLQAPPTKPSNWTRSRIRRQHLIALGIPVNLDEVLPRANGKPLPTLEIHTRPMSAPPGGRNQYPNSNSAGGSNTRGNSRSGTPQPGQQGAHSHLGPKPEIDTTKINKLLQLSQGAKLSPNYLCLTDTDPGRFIDHATLGYVGALSRGYEDTDSKRIQPINAPPANKRSPSSRFGNVQWSNCRDGR